MIFNHVGFICVIFIAINHCEGHTGRHNGHAHYQPKNDGHKNILKDKEYIRDYEHIKEDVQDMYNKDFADKLEDAEMEIFYFQLHDLNNDQQLDGLELLAAMNHVMNRVSDIPAAELRDEPVVRQSLQTWWNDKFEEDSKFIDEILKDEDADEDGFLSYFEFSLGRMRDRGEA